MCGARELQKQDEARDLSELSPAVSFSTPDVCAKARLVEEERRREAPAHQARPVACLPASPPALPPLRTSVWGGGNSRMLLPPLLAFLGLLARAKVVLCAPEECFPKIGIEGGDIVLSPRTEIKGNEISFKKEGNIVAEWDSNFTYFPPLVGRANIDIDSGNLTIRNLSQVDAGNYKVEITVADVVHTTCFDLEIQVPLEPPVLHCIVDNGNISINCTSAIQDSQLKYEWKDAKMENIDYFQQSVIQLESTKHSENITCVITLRSLSASNSISLSSCVSKEPAVQKRSITGFTALPVIVLVLAAVGVGIFFYRRDRYNKTYVPTQTGNSSNEEALAERLNTDNRDETENSGQNNRE